MILIVVQMTTKIVIENGPLLSENFHICICKFNKIRIFSKKSPIRNILYGYFYENAKSIHITLFIYITLVHLKAISAYSEFSLKKDFCILSVWISLSFIVNYLLRE